MRLYHCTQVSQRMGLRNRRERHHCWMVQRRQVFGSKQQEGGDLIGCRRLPNPVLASHQHTALHRELLFCYRQGLLPRRKPELLRVLEHKQRERLRQRELALRPLSDLEAKLRVRQQRIQVRELEEKRRNESRLNVPEFVRVRGSLRRVPTSSS